LETAFPIPKALVGGASEAVRKQFDREMGSALARRIHAKRLFEGDGTGMDVKATKDTAYGLIQSVFELIDYGVPHEIRRASARSAGMGIASRIKRRTLEHLNGWL
jgi:hypothetical protein